ncbi:hypothetical protein KX252_07610 [Escherichia coli]|nr:hypothetical protein [Escherichia coli]
MKNDGHYFCRAGGNRPDGLNEPVTKSAREQQKRRDERADGSVPLKLSGKIHKQLESIARSRGVLPKKLLNEMIEQAYQDFVANEQHKTLS